MSIQIHNLTDPGHVWWCPSCQAVVCDKSCGHCALSDSIYKGNPDGFRYECNMCENISYLERCCYCYGDNRRIVYDGRL